MAFILLPPENKVLYEAINDNLHRVGDANNKVEPLDSKLYDFDDVFYRLFIDYEDRSKMTVSLETTNWKDCKDKGSLEWIKSKVGNYVKDVTDNGVQFELGLADTDDYKSNAEEIAAAFSRLRVYALGGPLFEQLTALAGGNAKTEPFQFALRKDTHFWIVPKKDRVVCVFAMDFAISADKIIANQVLTEFVAVRRERDVANTPSITFSKDPPQELNGLPSPTFGGDTFLGYFSVLVLPSHIATPEKLENAVGQIIGFRSYLTYHIKCAKAYFHQRMRARVKSLLQTLNRARYDPPDERKKKKTIVSAK